MAKKTFNVGTIEEDFKKIGLLSDEKEITEAHKKVKGDKESSIPNRAAKPVEADTKAPKSPEASKDDESDSSDESDDEDGEPASEATVPTEPELTERLKFVRKRRANAKLKSMRRKQKILRRRNKSKLKQKAKRWRKSPRGKRFMRKYKTALKRVHGHAPKGRRISLRMGLDRVSNLIEEVNAIVKATDAASSKQESVKSFANMALIANDLAEGFGEACKASQEAAEESKKAGEAEDKEQTDFCAAAKDMESVAERAADLSEALNASLQEGAETKFSDEELKTAFTEIMGTVMEGLELFADLTEAAEEPEEEVRP